MLLVLLNIIFLTIISKMSVSNLFVPNNYDLYANSLTANTLNITNEHITNLWVANIFTDSPNDLLIQPASGHVVNINSDTFINNSKDLSIEGGNLSLNGGKLTTNVGDLTIDSDNIVIFNKGFELPTPSGTPSILDYYEKFVGDAVYTGAFSNTVTGGLQITRIGNMVFCTLENNVQVATAAQAITMSSLPARFTPTDAATVYGYVIITSVNGTNSSTRARVDINGQIIFYSDLSTGTFNIGNSVGIPYKISLQWPIL